MAKKSSKGNKQRRKNTAKAKTKKEARQPQTMRQRVNSLGHSTAQILVTLPRYTRVLVAAFLSLAVTLSTFPLLTWFFRLVAWVTRNPDLILAYTFAQERGTLNVLLGISFVVGALFYIIGWRIFVGTVGEVPPAQTRVVWYILTGILAIIITASWMTVGVFTGSAPATTPMP